MKGVIVAAGKGKRLRPLSYTVPKPLLPVANQPMIQYGINQLIQIGITEIGIVIHPEHEEIFKEKLAAAGKGKADIHYFFQTEQKGISHAVLQAEKFIGEEPFILLLGDNIIAEPMHVLQEAFRKNNTHGSVMLSKVSRPQDYGIADIQNGKIVRVLEKPDRPPSNLAVVGAYVFDPVILRGMRSIPLSQRGEYEITDAIQWMLDRHYTINYVTTNKPTFDVGTIERWLQTNQWILQQEGQMNDSEFSERYPGSIIHPPVKIGQHCTIENSVIGPYVSIGSNATIRKSVINNSVILQGSCLKDVPYQLKNSVIGEEAKIIGKVSDDSGFMEGIFSDTTSIILSDKEQKEKDA